MSLIDISKIIWLGLVVLGMSVTTACAAERPSRALESPAWNIGDDGNWASKEFDSSNWQEFDGLTDAATGIFWIRAPIVIDDADKLPANNVLTASGAGAFDVYFDGVLLGSSGAVGADRRDEQPGAVQFNLGVPRDFLQQGTHMLAVRASTQYLRDPSDFFLSFQLRSAEQTFTRKSLNLVLLGMGLAAIMIVSGYYAASSNARQQPAVFASTMIAATGIAAISAIEASEALGLTLYSWHYAANWTAFSAALLIFFALPALLLLRFEIAKWQYWIAGLILPVASSAIDWDGTSYEHDTRMFISLNVYCLAICARASAKGTKHARYYAASIGLCLVGIVVDPQSMHAFLVALAIFLALGFALDIRARELAAQKSQLAAIRLEAEMLKRNIQPHFLMNSLTAITEWIETAPTEALRFIHGLAEEFRSLSKLSGETLVPLTDELELCRTHLLLMGMRQKKLLCLETTGLSGTESVPPGIFHTLIENAVSHNRYRGDITVFEIAKVETENEIEYVFSAPLGMDTNHKCHSTGTGEKYITSRLEESYPGSWYFDSRETDGHWVTKITLKG